MGIHYVWIVIGCVLMAFAVWCVQNDLDSGYALFVVSAVTVYKRARHIYRTKRQ